MFGILKRNVFIKDFVQRGSSSLLFIEVFNRGLQLSHLNIICCCGINSNSNIHTCYDVVHQGGGHAEDTNQQVTDGQVENENVGDRTHVLTAQHDEAHHTVPHHARQKDEKVGDGEDGSHGGLMEIKVNKGDILVEDDALL